MTNGLRTDAIFAPFEARNNTTANIESYHHHIPASSFLNGTGTADSAHSHFPIPAPAPSTVPIAIPPPLPPNGGQRKVFVGGLSWETDEKSLRDYFSRFGSVSDCVIMRDRHTGHPRGFGFVTYDDEYVAERVASARHELDGRQVEAKRAVPRSECVPNTSNNNGNGHVSPPGGIFSSLSLSSLPTGNGNGNGHGNMNVNGSSAINNNKKVFVGGLPATCGTDQFANYFRKFGTISDAQVMYDHHTGNSRGFGFVTFQNQATVEMVVDGCEHDIMGKFVDVKRAEPRQVLDARRRKTAAAAAASANGMQSGSSSTPSSLMNMNNNMSNPVSITPSSVNANPKFNMGLNNSLGNGNGISSSGLPMSLPGNLHQRMRQQQHPQPHPQLARQNNGAMAMGTADDGFGIFESANLYSPQIPQTVHSTLFGSAAPPDIFSMFARPVASARVDRRYHPYASRERISRRYW